MAKKKKYYVVWEGNDPGVYDSWTSCQLQIKGYPNARYKSFPTKEEAIAAYGGQSSDFIGLNKKSKPMLSEAARADIIWNSIAVDAACSGNPGDMEYRGVDTKTGMEFFRMGPFRKGTNNVGEFLALVHGIAFLKKQGKDQLPIYSDSRIAMGWVKRKVVRTKLQKSKVNEPLFELIDRGLYWLKNNSYQNPILKWETKLWGEIPADFGRK
ncbi:MAG: viroplasmin family protein [Saprospiraceae bacterium]